MNQVEVQSQADAIPMSHLKQGQVAVVGGNGGYQGLTVLGCYPHGAEDCECLVIALETGDTWSFDANSVEKGYGVRVQVLSPGETVTLTVGE